MSQEAIRTCIQANVPFIWWGPPGVGKTEIVGQTAAAMGLHLETVIASLREPSDFGGLPVLRVNGVELEAPVWAKRFRDMPDDKRVRGLVFFDEFNNAPPAVAAGVLRILTERVVGDFVLPKSVLPCAAANPPEMATNGYDLAPPTANRFCHLQFKVDYAKWIDWVLAQVDLPAGNLFAGFVKVRPHLLHVMPAVEHERSGAWPSPRSITMAARLYGAAENSSDDLRMELVAGCVGEGWALEFLNWLKNLDLPDPEELLAKPSKFKLPARGDVQFAVLTSISGCALRNLTKERWLAAWEILGLAADQGGADIAACAARPLVAMLSNTTLKLPTEHIAKKFTPLMRAVGRLPTAPA